MPIGSQEYCRLGRGLSDPTEFGAMEERLNFSLISNFS